MLFARKLASSAAPLPLLLLLFLSMMDISVQAFTTATTTNPITTPRGRYSQSTSRQQLFMAATSTTKTLVPNPFMKLPWNVRKVELREQRRLAKERALLHRQLGIAEDATYENIVEATDKLIAEAGSDLKAKIQIEVAKDKILQHRLNERLAGLSASTQTTEARAQSSYEIEGIDEDDVPNSAAKEWNAPQWTRGLIVKPDRNHLTNQIRLWGIVTLLGIGLPPVQEYLGRFTWLICVAQLTFRGMPKEEREGGGMGMNFGASRGGSHRKVAFALGFVTWIFGAIVAYGMIPSWGRGQRWTNSVAFALQNLIFGLVSCYFQPYKGK